MTGWDLLYRILQKTYALIQSETAQNLIYLLGGAIITVFVQFIAEVLKDRGKLKIYYQNCRNHVYNTTACFATDFASNTKNCYLPMEIVMVNTSGKNKVVRNLDAIAMSGNKQVEVFNSLRSVISKPANEKLVREKSYGTIFTSYSYMIPAHNCIQSELLYIMQINAWEAEKYSFDHIDLVWYDEKDKKHRSTIATITECWKDGTIDISLDPQPLEMHRYF